MTQPARPAPQAADPQATLRTLLSLSAADALGAATEFKTPQAIASRYGPAITTYQPGSVFGFAPGEATDDSQMVAATLLGYARGEGWRGVPGALRDWVRAGPPDVGGLTRTALRSGSDGAGDGGVRAWAESGYHSAGNGGLMRIAAVWIAGYRGEALARESAVVTALTHADPRCVVASVFFTAYLEALAGGAEPPAAARQGLSVSDDFDARGALMDAGLFGADTLEAGQRFRAQERSARAEVRSRVNAALSGHLTSQSGYVLDTLEAAVKHALADSWHGAVGPAVSLGDDSDTVACVVGAAVGARGLDVPAELLPDLRLGHSWPGWSREWACTEHFPRLLAALPAPVE